MHTQSSLFAFLKYKHISTQEWYNKRTSYLTASPLKQNITTVTHYTGQEKLAPPNGLQKTTSPFSPATPTQAMYGSSGSFPPMLWHSPAPKHISAKLRHEMNCWLLSLRTKALAAWASCPTHETLPSPASFYRRPIPAACQRHSIPGSTRINSHEGLGFSMLSSLARKSCHQGSCC